MSIESRCRAAVVAALSAAVPAAAALAATCAVAGDDLPPIIPAQLPCGYEVVTIIPPPCGFLNPPPNTAYGVNNHGVVVGHFSDCNDPAIRHGWYWTEETGMVILPPPPGYESVRPVDINDAGVIAGTFRIIGAGDRAFLYDHGEWTDLGTIDGFIHATGRAMNETSKVVGEAWAPSTAFLYAERAIYAIDGLKGPTSVAQDINHSGVIAGWHGSILARQPFVSMDGKMIDIELVPGGFASNAKAINNSNVVEMDGQFEAPGWPGWTAEAFIYSDGTFESMGTPPGEANSWAEDLNAPGVAIGNNSHDGSVPVGFVWHRGVRIHLIDLIADGIVSKVGTQAMNDNGVIVGGGNITGNLPVGTALFPKPRTLGDLNCDQQVDGDDLALLLGEWNESRSPADLDNDDVVDGADLAILLGNWGRSQVN